MLSGHLSAAVEHLHCASHAFLRLYFSFFFSMQLLAFFFFFFQLGNCSHLISTHEVYSFCLVLAEVKPQHLPEKFCLPANCMCVWNCPSCVLTLELCLGIICITLTGLNQNKPRLRLFNHTKGCAAESTSISTSHTVCTFTFASLNNWHKKSSDDASLYLR